MNKILVIASHPNLESSCANKIILTKLQQANFDIEVRHLDSLYDGYDIDIAQEQNKLLQSDIIVMQFPFYWYSVPATLKNWIDRVLTYGFAYGSAGDKLKGKKLIVSTTIGGPEEAYSNTGYNNFTVTELLRPIEQTAYLTQMDWQEPVYTHGCIYIPNDYNTQEEVELRASNHAEKLIHALTKLHS